MVKRISQRKKQQKPHQPAHRGAKYHGEKTPAEVEELYRSGTLEKGTLKELAYHLGIHYETMLRWWKQYPELHTAAENGQQQHERIQAENALRDLITGERYWTKTKRKRTITKRDSNGNPYPTTETETIDQEHYRPPNDKAIAMYLQSRFPDRWPGPKSQVDVNAEHHHRHDHRHLVEQLNLNDFTTEELREFRQYMQRINSGSNKASIQPTGTTKRN